MRNPSKFTTSRQVDDALVQDADFVFDSDDRQYIDNQIRGLQQYIVENQLATTDVSTTGTINDLSAAGTGVFRMTGAAPTVTGFSGGAKSRPLLVFAIGGPLILSHESASSSTSSRITTDTGADVTIAQNGAALLIYDATSSRWRIVGSTGGGVSLSTTHGTSPQAAAEVDTADATATAIGAAVSLATDSVTTIDVSVQAIQAGASKAKIWSVRRSFLNAGGTVTDGTQQDLITPEELGSALAASVAITRTGTTAQPKVTGIAATNLRWYLISQQMSVTAAAVVGSAPVVTAISPDAGTVAGGTTVTITVNDSTGCTGATVGGVALTSLTIVDATHVRGVTGAYAGAPGSVDVTVTNGFGTGTLAGAYLYFHPSLLSPTMWLDSTHLTQGSGIVTAFANQGSTATNPTINAGEEPSYTAANANYNGGATWKCVAGGGTKVVRAAAACHGLTTGPRTFVIVGQCAPAGVAIGSPSVGSDVTGSGGSGNKWQATSDGVSFLAASAGPTPPAVDANTPCVMIVVLDGASSRIYVNSVTSTTGNTGTLGNFSAETLMLGNYGTPSSTLGQNGDTRHILAFNAALTDSQCQNLANYFGPESGITIT